MAGKISTTGMFRDNEDGSRIYYPNGIWSKKGYLLSDDKQKRVLSVFLGVNNVLMFASWIVSLEYHSWLLFFLLLLVIHLIYMVVAGLIVKDNEQTNERITFREMTIQSVKEATFKRLYFTLLSCLTLLGWLVHKLNVAADDIEYRLFSLLVIALVSLYSVYAIRVKKQIGNESS